MRSPVRRSTDAECSLQRLTEMAGERIFRRVGIALQRRAQDFQMLVERNRRALRIHVGVDVAAGLAMLHDAMRAALSSNAMTFV